MRDRISIDTWRILSQLDRDYQQMQVLPLSVRRQVTRNEAAASSSTSPLPPRPTPPGVSPVDDLADALDMLDQMVITLAAFAGLGTESMLRNQGWRFLDMGRRIERASTSIDLIAALLPPRHPQEGLILDALLEVMASAMSYRQRYLAMPSAVPTADMLILDPTNPRSVAYQLNEVSRHLDRLPRRDVQARRIGADQRLALEMLTSLRLADAQRLIDPLHEDGPRAALTTLLGQLAQRLPKLSDAIARQFLSHNAVSSRLGQKLTS